MRDVSTFSLSRAVLLQPSLTIRVSTCVNDSSDIVIPVTTYETCQRSPCLVLYCSKPALSTGLAIEALRFHVQVPPVGSSSVIRLCYGPSCYHAYESIMSVFCYVGDPALLWSRCASEFLFFVVRTQTCVIHAVGSLCQSALSTKHL